MRSDALDELYQDIILDHFRRPRHHDLLEAPDLRAEGFNPFCGDRVVLTADLDETGRISGVGFSGEGCAISQASASMMTQLLKGRTLEEASALAARFKGLMKGSTLTAEEEEDMGDLAALEGVRMFPVRIKCALLGWSALQDALAAYSTSKSEG
jgi:nitrogen fixation NifU-like protein